MSATTMKPAGARLRCFKSYSSYKDSGVEWLGNVPAHWVETKVKFLGRYINGYAFKPDDWSFDGLPIIRIQNLTNPNAVFNRFAGQADPRYRVTRGDILISWSASLGLFVWPLEEDAWLNQHIFKVVLREDLVAKDFFVWLGEWFIRELQKETHGSTMTHLTNGRFGSFRVDLPPIQEQRAIAAFVDRETARIDALVAKKEKLIELLQEERTGLITRTVSEGLDPSVPMKDSGIEALKKIPAHWEVKRLWHLTPSDRRIMYGIVLPGPNVDDGVPIVKGGDVSSERLRLNLLNRTTREIESSYVRSRLRGGDLVYAIRGSIGEVAIVPDELEGANLTQDAARIAYTRATHGPWLLYVLKSAAVFAQLEAGALGATIRGINIRDLKRASITVPPHAEQRAIAAFLDRETARIDALVAKVRDGTRRLREFRTALISAAVTGKIDVREEVA